MIELILQYKWTFFIIGEIVFWGSITGFVLLRYLFGLDKLSKYFIYIWLLSDLWLLFIGILDYTHTGKFDTFQMIIIVFLIYALTFGKKDFKRLDRFIKRNVRKWKGEEPEAEEQAEKIYGMPFFINELKGLAIHVGVYGVVLITLAFLLDLQDYVDIVILGDLNNTIKNITEKGLFMDPAVGKATGIWTLVLIIDAIITFSYLIFPKKK
ncbi:hypothetical protein [Bacillus sp. CECT 9360]|uniref:hypothetical protein n=1 Tax=Bacillus sp. CECT 9360 TaxID=2845821 RepID=UPI001E4D5956|nr:hypothetical protein [Bacillus sp. CECT 9360]CAH0343964.1 hypothetical protein BCI9360_00191 [Bacillus sp. CECT 9360]